MGNSQQDSANSRFCDAVYSSYFGVREFMMIGGKLSNLPNLLTREFRARCFFALVLIVATFSIHVGNIILMCAEPEVRGIAAQSIITGMTDLHTVGNLTPRDRVSEPVSARKLATSPELTVSIFVCGCCPIPAVDKVGDGYFCPESGNGIAFRGHTTPRLVFVRHDVCSQGGDETTFSGATLDHRDIVPQIGEFS